MKRKKTGVEHHQNFKYEKKIVYRNEIIGTVIKSLKRDSHQTSNIDDPIESVEKNWQKKYS